MKLQYFEIRFVHNVVDHQRCTRVVVLSYQKQPAQTNGILIDCELNYLSENTRRLH